MRIFLWLFLFIYLLKVLETIIFLLFFLPSLFLFLSFFFIFLVFVRKCCFRNRRSYSWSARKMNDTCMSVVRTIAANMCLVSASILHDLSDMQPQINAIKIEHPPYYCSSYTPPSAATTADHVQPAASFSKFQNLPLTLFLVDRVGGRAVVT